MDRAPPPSRRRVLAALAATAMGAPALLAGCGRSGPERTTAPVPSPSGPPPDPRAAVPEIEPIVRVRIARCRGEEHAVLGGAGEHLQVAVPARTLVLAAPVTVRLVDGAWRLRDAGGADHELAARDAPWVLVVESGAVPLASGAPVTIDGRPYHGGLSLHAVAGATPAESGFDAVNHVLLESYLPGVLARELYGHWHEEAFCAQAVAARSFAVAEAAFFRHRRHFDLVDTQRSQVYQGVTAHPRSLAAAARTEGLVLAWQGRVVHGYYSACCGGRAAAAVDAIGGGPLNDLPPLEGGPDDDACAGTPFYAWQASRRADALAASLATWGRANGAPELAALGPLRTIEPIAVSRTGRPRVYRLLDARNGTAEINAEAFRRALNASDESAGALRSSFFAGVAAERNGTLRFDGRGFGHGVGLCQYGAQARATAGARHDAILAAYYPGAELVRGYGRITTA